MVEVANRTPSRRDSGLRQALGQLQFSGPMLLPAPVPAALGRPGRHRRPHHDSMRLSWLAEQNDCAFTFSTASAARPGVLAGVPTQIGEILLDMVAVGVLVARSLPSETTALIRSCGSGSSTGASPSLSSTLPRLTSTLRPCAPVPRQVALRADVAQAENRDIQGCPDSHKRRIRSADSLSGPARMMSRP